jgi:hypothetical protein
MKFNEQLQIESVNSHTTPKIRLEVLNENGTAWLYLEEAEKLALYILQEVEAHGAKKTNKTKYKSCFDCNFSGGKSCFQSSPGVTQWLMEHFEPRDPKTNSPTEPTRDCPGWRPEQKKREDPNW